MIHPHRAADIAPGDIVTYQPDPDRHAPGMPASATVYILAVGRQMRGVSYTYSSWEHLHADRIGPGHPVTITRPQWAMLGAGMMSHIINAEAGDHFTWCGGENAVPVDFANVANLPRCRTCGYRAAKLAEMRAEHAADFQYRLPGDEDESASGGDAEPSTEE